MREQNYRPLVAFPESGGDFVSIPYAVDSENFVEVSLQLFELFTNTMADRQSNKHTEQRVPPPLSGIKIILLNILKATSVCFIYSQLNGEALNV